MSLVPRPIDFDECWQAECVKPLTSLFRTAPPIDAAALYYNIYHLCVATPRDHLLDVYHNIGRIFIDEAVRLREEMLGTERSSLLSAYARVWRIYSRAVGQINALCMYVNKVIEKLRDEHLPGRTAIAMVNGERMEVRLKPVGVLGLHIWKKAVLVYAKEKHDIALVGEILAGIGALRAGGKSATALEDLEATIKSFYECDPREYFGPIAVPFKEGSTNTEASYLPIYEDDVERPLIEATKEFYGRESLRMIAEESITEYVRYAERRLWEEIQLARTTLPMASAQRIIATVEGQLITAHTRRLQQDFSLLLLQGAQKDLEIVYRLLKRIPDGIGPLAECFEAFIVQQALKSLDTLKEAANAGERCCGLYVSALGPLHRTFTEQVGDCFHADARFLDRVATAYRQVVSLQPPGTRHDSGHLLADFFDMLMQDEISPDPQLYGSKASKAIQTSVDDAVHLVSFLEDKESFVNAYIKHLAKRLLFRLSHHGDIEAGLIPQLGQICGHEMQVRMQKMFTDMHTSLQLQGHFAQYLDNRGIALDMDVRVNVPTYIVWPLAGPAEEDDPADNITPQMQAAVEHFGAFHRESWPNRRLTWLHHLSRVHLDYRVDDGRRYELVVTVPQMALLMQFQERDAVRAGELASILKVTFKDLLVLLRPIVLAGVIRWRDGEHSQVGGNDSEHSQVGEHAQIEWRDGELLLNGGFKCEKSRIRLCHYSLGPSIEADVESPTEDGESTTTGFMELAETPAELSENKRFFLQAIIVRLLKQHKEMSPIGLAQLVAELATQPGPVSFQPAPAHLHAVIEQLVEKQYIEYDDRRDLYIYQP